MGRGDRNKVRWAHDRTRAKKERDARVRKEAAAAKPKKPAARRTPAAAS